jgi:putative protease
MDIMYRPELLLPVGNYQMCLAAIHNGADAIYVGMPEFNARGRSHDHSWDDLGEIIELCHLYGVQVHLAFNILIFENEIEKAVDVLDKAMGYGPDALIVQDVGLISIIRKRYPDVIIHGSTQMTVTNHEAIDLLEDLSINRFVLGRENSIDEISQIKNNTNKELEVFVHGALCVAYSGQCFTSESLGGRSANRGQCAQSCRFDYELFVDNEKKDLGINKYLVSPQDLCGIEEVPRLMEIGIESFKVEGRLKSAEFVGTVAKSYKEQMNTKKIDLVKAKEDMGVTYSRGMSTGWLHGVAHQELVEGSFKENRGAFIGEVQDVFSREVVIHSKSELHNGDGLLFVIENQNIVKEFGEKIYQIKSKGDFKYIQLGPKLNLKELSKGVKVYLTRKESLIKDVSQSISDKNKNKKILIQIELRGGPDEYLSCFVDDGENQFELKTQSALESAKSRPMTTDDFKKNLCGMSHTAYLVNSFENKTVGSCYIHNKELKKLKQEIVIRLNHLRTKPKNQVCMEKFVTKTNKKKNENESSPQLNILLRKCEQLGEVLKFLAGSEKVRSLVNYVVLDFEFGKDYFPSIKLMKEANIKSCIATTRILKPNEYHNFKLIERCKPDAILVRNLGALNFFQNKDYELIGDFSLNSSNSYTHEYLISKGLKSQCVSYDLNVDQVNRMIQNTDPSKLEITIHQYMPEFHMEHCVFAAFMSKGNSFKDCGKPCEKHDVHLKDMYGNRHEIKADQECRNTMFNAKAQSTVKYFNKWLADGVSFYRFESLHETGEELVNKLKVYLNLLSGETTVEAAYQDLGRVESYGLGVGSMSMGKEYKPRKKSNPTF